MKKLLLLGSLLAVPALLSGQAQTGGLNPADMTKPLADQWTSYSGDLSGKRYSLLKHVNTNTVKNLSLKWITSLTTGCGLTGRPTTPVGGGFGGGRGGGAPGPVAPIIVGGMAIAMTGAPSAAVLILVLLKTGLDLGLHLAEHREPPVPASTPATPEVAR